MLDLLSTSEEKLLKLLEELDGQDFSELLEKMDEEEYHAQMEGKLPEYNTRVKLPQMQRDHAYDGQLELFIDVDDGADVLYYIIFYYIIILY